MTIDYNLKYTTMKKNNKKNRQLKVVVLIMSMVIMGQVSIANNSVTETPAFNTSTGIEDGTKEQNLKIYPLPLVERENSRLPLQNSKTQINVSNLEKGFYYIQIRNEFLTYSRKVVKR